jgi:hypothetical protein
MTGAAMLTIERLKEVFNYDPETGEFSRADGSDMKIGSVHTKGGLRTKIDGQSYYMNRLAWFYVHGEMPFRVDHQNDNKRDFRIENLRPNHPSGEKFFGIGRIGTGPHSASRPCHAYREWYQMLWRCYGKDTHLYEGCVVLPIFHEYQAFAEWAIKQVGYGEKGFHMDKDLLTRRGGIYGPDTCVFIPNQINGAIRIMRPKADGLPTGVKLKGALFQAAYVDKGKRIVIGNYDCVSDASDAYKNAKSAQLSALAEQWKNKIDQRAYAALLNFYRAAPLQQVEKDN